ncbi:MAG: hypothetical protein K6B70_02815 [Clostridia bacterium]|nr:hypothetical protein [Clostridia bacterium]
MNQEEARKCILESLENSSLIATIGMNSDKVADNLYSSELENMHETIVEIADNHGESPEVFLTALLNHLLEKVVADSGNIVLGDYGHPYISTVKMINDINSTLVTDKYEKGVTNQLSITRRRMALYDNFEGIIENLRSYYSGKDFLILMKVSCDTKLTCQALEKLRRIAGNPHIKILLFIEMIPEYYNKIRENNRLDGFFDSEIYVL